MRIFLQASLFLICFIGQVYAQTFSIADKSYSANFKGSYFEFNEAVTDIKQAYQDYQNKKNITEHKKIVRKYSKKPIWMAFTVENSFNEEVERIIQFPFGCTDEMDLYIFDNDGNYKRIQKLHETPLKKREFKIRRLSAKLSFKPKETKLIIAKLVSAHQMSASFDIYSIEKAQNYEADYKVVSILYVGVALGLFLYNLFVGATSRKEYIYYYITALFLLSTLIMITADIPQYFGIVIPRFWHNTLPLHRAALIATMTMFTLSFLKTKEVLPKVHTFFCIFAVYTLIAGGLTFIDSIYHTMNVILKNLMTVNLVMILGLSLYVSIKNKSRPALLFTLATASLFISGIVYMLTWSFGIIPRNFMTANVILLGSAIEMTLFSLAIADSFKKQIIEQLERRLRVEKELKNLNNFLENKVKEKTSMLVDSKKRAALGELASGVAHEMNSPLSAVFNNLQYISALIKKESNEKNRLKISELVEKNQRIVGDVFTITEKLKSFGDSYEDLKEEMVSIDSVIQHVTANIEVKNDTKVFQTNKNSLEVYTCKARLRTLLESFIGVVADLNEMVFVSTKDSENELFVEISGSKKELPEWIQNYIEIPFYEHSGEVKGSGLELSMAKDALEALSGKVFIGSISDEYILKIIIPKKKHLKKVA